MERIYEVLGIGRCNADLVVRDADWRTESNGSNLVKIRQGEVEVEIPVDELPSEANDKVTSQKNLVDVVSKLDYSFMWGGGIVNSLKAFHQFQDRGRIKLLTTNRPFFFKYRKRFNGFFN